MIVLLINEAEYIAATSCANQAVLLPKMLDEMKHPSHGPTTILCDNNSIISLIKNSVIHGGINTLR